MSSFNPDFIREAEKYSFLLYDWTQDPSTVDFFEAIMGDRVEDLDEGWSPETDNYELGLFQKRFVSDTVDRVGPDDLTEQDADETFAMYLAKAAANLWEDKLRLSRLYSSTHLDNLVRQVVSTPPGPGIGYLSLILGSIIPLSDAMVNEIDISRKFSPELPFSPEETRDLMKITRKETRLRFALVIANAFGRCCDRLKVPLHESTFRRDFQKMIQHFILPVDSQSTDLVRDDLRLIIDILIFSKKEPSEVTVPPLSPEKPASDPQPIDELLEDIVLID